MGTIKVEDLPIHKGTGVMREALFQGQQVMGGIDMNPEALMIIGLCQMIDELTEKVERLEEGR